MGQKTNGVMAEIDKWVDFDDHPASEARTCYMNSACPG